MYRGEYFNSISHLVGTVLALIGATVLITLAALDRSAAHVAGVAVYGVTLVLLYLSSTLYHSFAGRAKWVFRRLDHGAIYLLIAGTYTPFALAALDGTTERAFLLGVWGVALAGILIDALPIPGPRILPVALYLLLGWSCVLVMDSFVTVLDPLVMRWLIAGGLCYSIGVVFFVLDHWISHMHGVWHLFVLAGSACHYVAVLLL